MACGGSPSPAVALVAGSKYVSNWTPPEVNITSGWEIVEVPRYDPPNIQALDIGAEPPTVPQGTSLNKPQDPYNAPDVNIHTVSLGTAPELDADKPAFYEPDQPGDLSASKPTDKPTTTPVVIPDAPTLTLPDVPLASTITIPDAAVLALPTWDQTLPTVDFDIPDNTFDFVEQAYSSDVLTQSTSEILRMLNGGVGLPESVWQQIFEKGADLEEQNGSKLIEEASVDWAARGWAAPGGLLEKRVRQARQAVQNARNTLARDVTIKRYESELENLKYAIAQGLALEGMMINLHNSVQERTLKAAELSVQIAISLLNAKIAVFNAELQAYQTAAVVFKSLVEAELAKVEIFKAEIEAEALKVQIDQSKIDLYKAQIAGLNSVIDLHNSQIKSLLAVVEVDKAKVDIYRTEVQAYATEVQAWATEWSGYKNVLEAQTVKADIYKTQVQAFATETEAYKTGIDAQAARVNADVAKLQGHIGRMTADVSRYSAQLQAEVGRIEADVKQYSVQMDGYKAKAAYTSAQADAYRAELNGYVESAKAAASAGIEGARIAASQADAIGRATTEATLANSRIYAQLEASHMGQYSARAAHTASSSDNFNYTCN